MPRKANLSVVTPDAEAPAVKLSVDEAAATGDHRKLLVSMRERIAKAVADDRCPPRDLASLTRRLQDIAREIEALDLKALQEGDDSAAPDEAFDASAI